MIIQAVANVDNTSNNLKRTKQPKLSKRTIYIFIGVVVVVVIIGIFLVPVPSQNYANQALLNAASHLSTDQPFDYTPTKVDFDNFTLPVADMKLYRYVNDTNQILEYIKKEIPGLTSENSENNVSVTLYNSNYNIVYVPDKKFLTFHNNETASSVFDGFTESNALEKISKIFGPYTDQYNKYISESFNDGSTHLGFTKRVDGINVEFANDQRTNLDLSIKGGKLMVMEWTLPILDSGAKVSLSNLDYIKKNFDTLPKSYFSDRSLVSLDPNSPQGQVPQGASFDTSEFKGTIKITGGTLIYFSQNITSNYVLPTYKLRAKFTDNNKTADGFVYVPAYPL